MTWILLNSTDPNRIWLIGAQIKCHEDVESRYRDNQITYLYSFYGQLNFIQATANPSLSENSNLTIFPFPSWISLIRS